MMFEKLMEDTGLAPRPQQTTLVKDIREAENEKKIIFRQAGTGTGKSFVLLAMALELARLTKMPSVVVAPTNSLVNQYVMKDAPAVQKILGGEFTYLKGRSLYLCTQSVEGRKLKKAEAEKVFHEAVQQEFLEWAQLGEAGRGWGCTGDCNPKFGDLCAMQIAKERAGKADVIVTNGHVLIWDLKVEQMTAGVARLLPAYGTLFVDECHELDSVAKGCNSDQIGPNSSVYDMIDGFREWVQAKVEAEMLRGQNELLVEVTEDDNVLISMVEDATRERGRLESLIAGMMGDEINFDEVKRLRKDLKVYERFIAFATGGDDRFISTVTKEFDKDGDEVLMLNKKCVDASSWTRPILTNQTSVLVSGTIPPSLPARLGVRDATLEDVGTPFKYHESVLAISAFSAKDARNNPAIEAKRVREVCGAVVDMARRSHEDGGGGTLLLFTSWKDLESVMPEIEKALAKEFVNPPPVYRQSRGDQQETASSLDSFKAHGHAVMGGVQSLWTGVDVPGEALRQVVIYQLPWGVPTLEVKAIEKKYGRQPYQDDMMTRLVQGIGRLVRRVEDNGRVFIADSRAKNVRWHSNTMSKHVPQFSPFQRG